MKLNRFLALFLLLLTSVFSSEKFTMTYGDILKGDVRSIGGTLLENSRIDRHRMKYKDLDNDHTTRNSSYGWLGLNKNKKIVYAKLYWWGATKSIAKNGEESVKVKLPYEKRYKTVYADDIYKDDYYYLGVKDITNDLKNHHKGKVWVSNNYIKEGKYALAGWTLVVVYKNQSKSNKEIIIYDGLDRVTNTHDVKISFKKHSRKEQSISVGTFGGNRHTNGDSMFFNETPVKRYGRTDNLFVGFAFWYDNAIAMDYFSTLTNIQQDDLEITFKTKKDQHLPFVMVYRNTIENEETRAFQKGEIEEKNNSKWVKITSLFETRKGRKKEIKELVYQTHVPNYSTADTDSFKTNGEKTPPKKKGYGYDVYIGDSDKAKVTYTLKVPKNKSTKNIESDLKSCFKYNYIYQNNRREICSNRTLFTGKKEDIKYQKELEEARLLENSIDLTIASGLIKKAKKKGDDKQVELLKKKEKLLENVIRKQEKYIDTLTKKEAEKPDNKPQKNIMIKEENRVAYPVLKPEIKKVQTPLIPQKVGEKKDFFKQKVSSNRAVNQQVKNIEIIENNLAKNKKEIIEKAPVDNSEKLAVIDEIQKKIEYKKQQAKNTGNKRELKRLQRKERALKRRADILRKEDRKAQLEYEKKVKDIEEKPEAIQKENKQLTKVDSQEKNKFYGVTLGSSLATVTSKWNTTPPRKNEPQTSMTSSLGAYGGYKKSNLRGLASFDYHLWSNSSLILLTLQGDYIFPQSIYNGNIFAGAFGGLGVFETQLTGSSGSGSVFGADFGYIQTIGKEFELEVGIKYIMPSIETSDSDHNVFLESIFNTYFGVNKKF